MKRRLFTMVMALALGAAGAILVLLYVRDADRRALAGKRAVDVLVAAKAIPAGTRAADLTAGGWVRTVRMPAETVPDDRLSAIGADLADRVVAANIAAGELIRRPLLVVRSRSRTPAVPAGKIAITVALTDPRRVGGHVTAGDKVAVFVSYKLIDKGGKVRGDATGARLLMAGIDVLATGPAPGSPSGTQARDASAGTNAPTLVTLAVTQTQAEKLVWAANGPAGAAQDGGLYLGLQTDSSVLDENDPGISSFTFRD